MSNSTFSDKLEAVMDFCDGKRSPVDRHDVKEVIEDLKARLEAAEVENRDLSARYYQLIGWSENLVRLSKYADDLHSLSVTLRGLDAMVLPPRPDLPAHSEYPIAFARELFGAILSDRKTQTRRLVKCAEHAESWSFDPGRGLWWYRILDTNGEVTDGAWLRSPYVVGKRLWVYSQECVLPHTTLEVTSVSVERLQDISADDALAEGFDSVDGFLEFWSKIYNDRIGCSWDYNPWVWVVGFRRIKENQ